MTAVIRILVIETSPPLYAVVLNHLKIRGGPLTPGFEYTLDHMTWRWGSNSSTGSEHVIGNTAYVFHTVDYVKTPNPDSYKLM